jgi:multisubunit Na+/H+ antiporter MnhB subunit
MSQLVVFAAAFIAIGVGIAWKQSRAKFCPVHSRFAGKLAWGIAALTLVLGVLIIVFAIGTQ